MMPLPVSSLSHDPAGGTLVSTDGRLLPLTGATVTATARGGLAEVVLEQRFRNTAEVPLTVTYSFPLPADASVGAYAFTVGDRRIVGEIDRRRAARERFEQALIDGHTAGLVEQERSSLFTQEIGNIPPGAEVVAALTIDQPLRWLDEGAWEWRFPTTAAPRYLGVAGRVSDNSRVTQEIADGLLPARLQLHLTVSDPLAHPPHSPSHNLRTGARDRVGERSGSPAEQALAAASGSVSGAPVGLDVAFAAAEGVPLDRDLVVRWAAAGAEVGLALEVARPASGGDAFALLTVTPPAPTARGRALPRDLVVLLDTSGSMEGEPLAQARRVVSALIASLADEDRLELIAFSSAPARWKRGPVAATAAARRQALAWLAALRAGGGTEMRDGILAALRPLRADSQRQVVLVTDGLIGFESEVVAAIATRLPATSRVHTVGVGSAVNRSLTAAAARAGRGVAVLIGVGEDAEPAARRLVARTAAPLVVDLALSGSALVAHAPAALPDLFAGAPAVLSLQVRPEGGALELRGRTTAGTWRQVVQVAPSTAGEGRRAPIRLHARERIEDLETRIAAGESDHDREIERLGLTFQVSTRLTSWIAVSEDPLVDPTAPTRHVRMPQELPHGMSVEGLGLRSVGIAASSPALAMGGAPARTRALMSPAAPLPPASPAAKGARFSVSGLFRAFGGKDTGRPADSDDQDEATYDREEETAAPPFARKVAFDEQGEPADDRAQETPPPADQPGAGGQEPYEPTRDRPDQGKALRPPAGAVNEDGGRDEPGEGRADEAHEPQRRFRGSVILRNGDQLVIELEVDGADLDWRPGASVELTWPDGRRAAAALRQSTRAGTVRAGETIRLVIELAPGEPPPERITIAGPSGTVVVVI